MAHANKKRKKMSSGKKPKRKKRTDFSVSTPSTYIWKVLEALRKDLEPYLPPDVSNRFHQVIRLRDIPGYLLLCKKLSLQNFKYYDGDLESLRAMRLMTIAEKYLFPSEEDLRQLRAIEKFLVAEEHCRRFNERGTLFGKPNDDLFFEPIIEHAQHFCKIVLSEFNYTDIFREARFGPGSDIGTLNSRTHVFDKLCAVPLTCTSDSFVHAAQLVYNSPRWLRSLLGDYLGDYSIMSLGYTPETSPLTILTNLPKEVRDGFERFVFKTVQGNRINTVPKNGEIDRDMAKEPRLNLMLQLGVDAAIRRKLKHFGIDINDQTKNQILARDASKHDSGATIDLSQASNLITLLTFRTLLSKADPRWASFIEEIRSPMGRIHFPNLGLDETISYEKLSSMGNGATFAIETLLFSSLLFGVVKCNNMSWRGVLPRIAVYGDDIIAPQELVPDLLFSLRRCGFKVNNTKSFEKGCIRESCGMDFFNGFNIRPVYIREKPVNVADVFIDHNRIYRVFTEYFGAEPTHSTALFLKWVPEDLQFFGPIVESDTGWLFTVNRPRPRFFRSRWCTGWKIRRLRINRTPLPVPVRKRWFFQRLLALNRYVPEIKKFRRYDEEPPKSIFSIIGRNCPLSFHMDYQFVETWVGMCDV